MKTYFEARTCSVPVRPNDLDSFGHVNNAVVLEYLEAGRWQWAKENGLRGRPGTIPVVSRADIQYLRELRDETLVVNTQLLMPAGVDSPEELEDIISYRADMHQTIARADGVVAVRADVQIAFLDVEQRKLRTFWDYLQGFEPREASERPPPESRDAARP